MCVCVCVVGGGGCTCLCVTVCVNIVCVSVHECVPIFKMNKNVEKLPVFHDLSVTWHKASTAVVSLGAQEGSA